MLKEKKAMLIADNTTELLILSKSAIKKYVIASEKPCNVDAYAAKPISIKNKPGIKNLIAFSIPLFIPLETI